MCGLTLPQATSKVNWEPRTQHRVPSARRNDTALPPAKSLPKRHGSRIHVLRIAYMFRINGSAPNVPSRNFKCANDLTLVRFFLASFNFAGKSRLTEASL